MEIINYLEESALVANILSLLALGLLGVVLRSVLAAAGDVVANKVKLDEKLSVYQRMDLLEKIIYANSVLYRNAVINSNLTADGKQQTLNDFAVIEGLHNEYLEGTVIEEEPETNPEEQPDNTLLNAGTALIGATLATIATDAIEKAPSILDKMKSDL